MKIVKRTQKYFYVELGDNDLEDVFSSSNLIRVEREDIDKNYTLSDKVKCDGEYEEIDYCRIHCMYPVLMWGKYPGAN